MKVDLKTGATIASAVAFLLAASPARADDAKPAKAAKTVKCVGTNSCSGKGECGGAGNDCSGKNSCKGKGWTTMKSEKACKKAGGKVLAAK
jgi:uncharacterized membrane protein